jgi:acyl carrier protein
MATDMQTELARILDDVLVLNGRGISLQADSQLMGAIPELDSIAVLSVLEAIRDRFDVSIGDDEIDGRMFSTLGALAEFVSARAAS